MTEEQKHDHIKEIAEDYVSKSWNTFLDLEEIDLVMAGIGVGKIIASEQEKRIEELEAQIEKMKNRKVFLLQRVDSSDNSIDKQFYTTDEEFAKEWDDYHKCNHGKAIELEEF